MPGESCLLSSKPLIGTLIDLFKETVYLSGGPLKRDVSRFRVRSEKHHVLKKT